MRTDSSAEVQHRQGKVEHCNFVIEVVVADLDVFTGCIKYNKRAAVA